MSKQDATKGTFTTLKLQALIDAKRNEKIGSRRELADQLRVRGERISRHGVEAWFRHVDSNYNIERPSLLPERASYPVPKRRWQTLLQVFDIGAELLELDDNAFQIWCLEQPSTLRSDWHGFTDQLPTGIAGRARQHASFKRAIESALGGKLSMLTVEGEAGTGKSHLLKVWKGLLDGAPLIRLSMAGVEQPQIPFLPTFELLKSISRTSLTSELAERVAQIMGRYGELGAATDGINPYPELVDTLNEIADQATLALFVDDLHWLDEGSVRVLERLATTGTSKRYGMVLVTGRRPLPHQHTHHRILASLEGAWNAELETLGAFSFHELHEVLSDIASQPPAETLTQTIFEHSAGNPLLGLEMFRALERDGHLQVKGGELQTDSTVAEISNMRDIDGIYRNLLTSLSENSRYLLQVAAVFNRSFSVDRLQALMPRYSTSDLVAVLEEAEWIGIIQHRGDQFDFHHPIVRLAIYRSVSDLRRSELHFEVAQRLMSDSVHSGSRRAQIEIAHHLRHSGTFVDTETFVTYCAQAARAAHELQAWDQMILCAQAILESARELSSELRAELAAWSGNALHMTGNPQEALLSLSEARALFEKNGEIVSSALMLSEIVRIEANYGLVDPSDLESATRLEKLAVDLRATHPKIVSSLYDSLSARYVYSRRRKDAKRTALASYDVVADSAACEEFTLGAMGAGVASLEWLDLAEAERFFLKARESAIATLDRDNTERANQRLAMIHFSRGQFVFLEQDSQLLHSVTATGEHALVLAMRTALSALKTDSKAAESSYRAGLKLASTTGYIWSLGYLGTAAAAAYFHAGDLHKAREAAAQLKELNTFARLADEVLSYLALQSGDEPVETKWLRFHGAGYDLLRASRYCLQLENAVKLSNENVVRTTVEALQFAHQQGVVVTPGWPFLTARVIASGLIFLKDFRTAAHYLAIASDAAARLGFPNENAAIDELTTNLT